MIILDNTYRLNGQALQIFVKYDEVKHQVMDVKNIILHSHGHSIPVGTLLIQFCKDDILKMVFGTDWRPICAEFLNPKSSPRANIHPTIEQALQPFITH